MMRSIWIPRIGFLLFVACGRELPDSKDATVQGDVAQLVRNLSVEEPPLPLGGYTSFIAVRASGGFFVADLDRWRVVAYSPTGTVVGEIGRRGSGPGEFESPGILFMLGDTLLAVTDPNGAVIELFNPDGGAHLRSVSIRDFQHIAADWTVDRDTAYFPVLAADGVMGVWPISSDTAYLAATLPAEYQLGRPRGLLFRYGRIGVARSTRGMVAHLPTENGLRLITESGVSGELVPLPVRRRRGIPKALEELKASTSPERTREFPLASMSVGLARLGIGYLVAYHWEYDPDPAGPQGGVINLAGIRLFASVISPGLDSACIDIPIPILTDIPPFPITLGDTTFIFTRAVDTTQGTVATRLVGVRYDLSKCQWERLTSP